MKRRRAAGEPVRDEDPVEVVQLVLEKRCVAALGLDLERRAAGVTGADRDRGGALDLGEEVGHREAALLEEPALG